MRFEVALKGFQFIFMTLGAKELEVSVPRGYFGLSARRLWEHTELGQVNVFRRAISPCSELNVAGEFIDLVRWNGGKCRLLGLTIAEFDTGVRPSTSDIPCDIGLVELGQSDIARAFIRDVQSHLDRCAVRLAMRNQQPSFLPQAKSEDIFGIPYIFSSLQRRLQSMWRARATTGQWLKTINNFPTKGLRVEELYRSNLAPFLDSIFPDRGTDSSALAFELADACNFRDLRIAVIPVVRDAQRLLEFGKVTDKKLKRTKNIPKSVADLPRLLNDYDPVLGYRVERVEHESLWGTEHTWQAVTYEGRIIQNEVGVTGFRTAKEASDIANRHAQEHFPKRVALGRWRRWAWTGGESYREWLITLPYYPTSYLEGHFDIRNVLAHVRCDVREDFDGRRVLMLHEIQSDWAQQARRAISMGEMEEFDDDRPPFLKEWPALTMKLVLLHAAHQGVDAVAWTRGVHQVARYKGLGATGLYELYDRTLPREVNRMMKSFGVESETLGVFVPTNFEIQQTEYGYEVRSPKYELLGTAPTLEEAREFVPDRGHESLFDVHGVMLPADIRRALLAKGFPAWG